MWLVGELSECLYKYLSIAAHLAPYCVATEELFFSCSPDSSLAAETKHSGGALQWPLMTRAHFAQALVKLSMQQHTGQTHMVPNPFISLLRDVLF